MGAVHGVYLKYVGLSAISIAGYTLLVNYDTTPFSAVDGGNRLLGVELNEASLTPRMVSAAVLGYSAILNGTIAMLFQIRRGMKLIGKTNSGQIPTWSYVLWFPFHLPTILYTYLHTKHGSYKNERNQSVPVPVASEVVPGWWIGGRYSHTLDQPFAGIVDLTVEFPELCPTQRYHLIPVWDGIPPTPAQLQDACVFAAEAIQHGHVLIHCAHGRGRSTTVMVAALVYAGLFDSWEEAFEECRKKRKVIKLNSKMRKVLTEWQNLYILKSPEKNEMTNGVGVCGGSVVDRKKSH
mmetsp:Transcript_9148/g.13277  ORF Transcript_9148/g.13277 Transcript_9148/m.13277 type:complete len:294 (+) Transcript_9148:207-1088(+)|eukprot:CAMPEP_0195526606 /NCGR_PEP_ID=MMETSP0794_2-20130614/27768_1 /TAXON_ID=515487 /ORGANISM="Stephanopyxis turris, Strain CCMP 815" /LENGTH=293 /DNA_ID=CAMNT_0040657339 /DNA_START=192 /DNA_END=1073 /DNA_ORIENTATION=-